MQNLDYPCTCGHPAGQHNIQPTNVFNFCVYQFTIGAKHACRCQDFAPDNLRYLEMQIDVK